MKTIFFLMINANNQLLNQTKKKKFFFFFFYYASKTRKFKNVFLFFFSEEKKRKNEDKTRPKNDFWPTTDRKELLTKPKRQIRSRLTILSKNLLKKNKKNFLMKKKAMLESNLGYNCYDRDQGKIKKTPEKTLTGKRMTASSKIFLNRHATVTSTTSVCTRVVQR
jgi:hypothetical protein